MKIFNILMLALLTTGLSAQSLDEELGFIYVKADYLLETNRYDEAIAEFTKIIAKNPSFRDVMYKRAEAKFHVGAFQGTKNDLLEVFDLKGISPESVLLYGKAQKNLGNEEAAETTLATADILFPNGTSPRSKSPSQETDDSEDNDSLKKIEDEITRILDDLLPNKEGEETSAGDEDEGEAGDEDDSRPPTRTSTPRSPSTDTNDDSATTTNRPGGRKQAEPEPEPEPEPVIDDSVKEIYIDEDISLEVKNGLGARKILEQPSILVISTTTGDVVVDICVNENGKVTEAEYNVAKSSLKTESLISLAVRKSKEFWFKKDDAKEMCGTIVFKFTST